MVTDKRTPPGALVEMIRLTPARRSMPLRRISPRELATWRQQIASAPEVRWDKVRAVREALANGHYDLDGRLNDLLNSPPEGLLALARRSSQPES